MDNVIELTYEQHVENVLKALLDEWADENFQEWEWRDAIAEYPDVLTAAMGAWLLSDENPDYQCIGACLLWLLGDETHIPLLCQCYRATDDTDVHEFARMALEQLDAGALIWNDFFDAMAAYVAQMDTVQLVLW